MGATASYGLIGCDPYGRRGTVINGRCLQQLDCLQDASGGGPRPMIYCITNGEERHRPSDGE